MRNPERMAQPGGEGRKMSFMHGARTTLTVLLVGCSLVMSLAFAGADEPIYQPGKILVVPKGKTGATVSEFVTMYNEEAEARTTATVWWDETALRVVFDCADDTIVAISRPRDALEMWKDDCVEVFLDVGHTHEEMSRWLHVLVTAGGDITDECGTAGRFDYDADGLSTKVAHVDGGWRAEITIAWTDLGAQPKPGDVWGFNLNRTEHPEEEYLCFSPTRGRFHSIHQWGHIVFAEQDLREELGAETELIIEEAHRMVREQVEERRAEFAAKWDDYRSNRAKKTPKWINEIPDNVAKFLIERHRCEDGPVWGLAKANPGQTLPYDEVGSCRYVGSLFQYGLAETAGGLTEEKKHEAICFWQSWQDPKTGRFIDPRDPKRPVNEKYIVGLLRTLGAEPLYPWTTTSDTGEIDTEVFLQRSREDPDWALGGWGVGSHTGYMAVEIFDAINDEGREDLIPALEKGIEQILSHQDPESGLWGPPSAPLAGRLGGTLKVIGRFYFKMGLEVPHTKELADSLIKYQKYGDFHECSTDSCIPRNAAEVIAYCLEVSDYRREDLLTAMYSVALDCKEFVNPDGSISQSRGDPGGSFSAITYGLGVCAGYLGWDDCRLSNPLAGDPRGAGFKYRVVLQPDGSVRVVKNGEE